MREGRPVSHEIVWIEVDDERVPVQRPIYERKLGSPMIGLVHDVSANGSS